MIPNMETILKSAEEQQKGKVWLEFACAIMSNSKAIGYSTETLANKADEMVIEYNKRFITDEN